RTDVSLVLRHESNVNISAVDCTSRAADSRVGEQNFRMRARNSRRFFCLESCVVEVRSRRSLQSNVQLRTIIGAKEPAPNQSNCGKCERNHERQECKSYHCKTVIERPANQS